MVCLNDWKEFCTLLKAFVSQSALKVLYFFLIVPSGLTIPPPDERRLFLGVSEIFCSGCRCFCGFFLVVLWLGVKVMTVLIQQESRIGPSTVTAAEIHVCLCMQPDVECSWVFHINLPVDLLENTRTQGLKHQLSSLFRRPLDSSEFTPGDA